MREGHRQPWYPHASQHQTQRKTLLFVYLQYYTYKPLAHRDTRTRIAVSCHYLVDTKVGQVVDTHVSHFPPRPAAPCRESGLAQLQCERVSRITGLFPVGKLPCQQIFSCQFFSPYILPGPPRGAAQECRRGGHVRCVINGGWLWSYGYLAPASPPHPTHKRALNGEH